MENKEHINATDKVMAFDTLFTNNHIKMLKVLVFYLDSPLQNMLAVYIKFLELQHTLKYLNSNILPSTTPCSSCGNINIPFLSFLGNIDIGNLCHDIIPYCTDTERDKVQSISQMFQMMDNFKQISETMEMMKELFPDGISDPEDMFSFFGNGDTGNMDMFQMFSSMMNNSENLD